MAKRTEKRKLFGREVSFMRSIVLHGFKKSSQRDDLKFKHGIIIVSTKREDAEGIDFWIKLPYSHTLIPVQVTQRGVKHFKRHSKNSSRALEDFIICSNARVEAKRKLSKKSNIAFVLVRDWFSPVPSRAIAWGDMKALQYGLARL